MQCLLVSLFSTFSDLKNFETQTRNARATRPMTAFCTVIPNAISFASSSIWTLVVPRGFNRRQMESIDVAMARRLALARAGLLKPEWTGLRDRAPKGEQAAREAAHAVVRRFGFLQLDTVSITGARSHTIVLLSRLKGLDPALGESLLRPRAPLFEYWGHEASWIPMELYPNFEFRRRALAVHPWWGDLIREHPKVTARLRKRIREEGPLRSVDMEGKSGTGWWDLKIAKKVATALWFSGELAIRERNNFQRSYDLAERVIPKRWRDKKVSDDDSFETLLLLALAGHGWATRSTLAQTWRLRNLKAAIDGALARLLEKGLVLKCELHLDGGKQSGFVRPDDLALADRLRRVRPRTDRGVLLSPFDPVLWDRPRVQQLFGFEQILEIFKPAKQRKFGYYCMPVLAGDRLVARFDLKADKKAGTLTVLAAHHETPEQQNAAEFALDRYARALSLRLVPLLP